jgi:hypothetical protein
VTVTRPAASPLQALLDGAIDYAGMFPPAGLDLGPALDNYCRYRDSADAWALGRFVISAAHLPALAEGPGAGRIPLSVLVGPQVSADLALVERFRKALPGSTITVQALELRIPPGTAVASALADVPISLPRYVEVSLDAGLDESLDAIVASGAFAKVRTGGTTAPAFPSPESLARFLTGAARRRLPFKATAGLHHPLHGSYPLTYERGSASGTMYGYLNVGLAAALAWKGVAAGLILDALRESDPLQIRLNGAGFAWRSSRWEAATLAEIRRDFFHGFGSCSFREPLEELAILASAS